MGKHVTPSIDLTTLLYGSTSSSITQDDCERFIQYFYLELIENLELLKFPGKYPTLLEIQLTTYRVDIYSSLIVLFITGLRFVNQSFDGGFIEVANDEQTNVNQMYTHPACVERMKYLLNLFDRRGYFDF